MHDGHINTMHCSLIPIPSTLQKGSLLIHFQMTQLAEYNLVEEKYVSSVQFLWCFVVTE